MRIIDLTLPLYTGMPVYPGDPEVSIELVQTLETNGWDMRRLQINAHDGTHVNAPVHMVPGGKTLDDFSLEAFCGRARIYSPERPMTSEYGYLFRDHVIDRAVLEDIKRIRPHFVALSSAFEFDVEIEKNLLEEGIIVFERIANAEQLPDEFEFYGVPLKIKDGDGSPVRAFAVVR